MIQAPEQKIILHWQGKSLFALMPCCSDCSWHVQIRHGWQGKIAVSALAGKCVLIKVQLRGTAASPAVRPGCRPAAGQPIAGCLLVLRPWGLPLLCHVLSVQPQPLCKILAAVFGLQGSGPPAWCGSQMAEGQKQRLPHRARPCCT